MIADLEKHMEQAGPLLRMFHEAWHDAFAFYNTNYPELVRAEHDDSTAASCVRAHMLRRVVSRADDVPGCAVVSVRGLKVLNYFDRQVWRMKKVDSLGRHANYPTGQQEDFDDGEPLPDLPVEAVRLTTGYQLDAAGEFIERIIVARVIGRDVYWAAQTHMTGDTIRYDDITPSRFDGTDGIDFDVQRARRYRGRGR